MGTSFFFVRKSCKAGAEKEPKRSRTSLWEVWGDNRNNEMVAYAVEWRNPFGMPIRIGYVFLGWDLGNLMLAIGDVDYY